MINLKKAFTVLELAIVVTIAAITLTIVTSGYSSYYSNTKALANISTVKNAKELIQNYFAKNGYLPCPADPTLPITDPNFGLERLDSTGTGCAGSLMVNVSGKPYPLQNQSRASGNNYFLFGSLPVRSMGLPDSMSFDSYGNRITFIVHDSLANYKRHSASMYKNLYGYGNLVLLASGDTTNTMFGQSSSCALSSFVGLFGDTTQPTTDQNYYRTVMNSCNAQIMNSISNAVVPASQNNLAFALISYGKSGKGAWNNSGILNSISANPMEASNSYANYANVNGAYTANYVFDNTGVTSKPLKIYQGVKTATFDNIVGWSTISDLLVSTNSTSAIYCHPSTHPGFLTTPAPATYPAAATYYATLPSPPTLTKNGINYTLNGISKTCTGYGTWI